MNIKENDIVYEKNGFELAIKDIENSDNLIEIEEKDELDTTEKLIQKVNEIGIPIYTDNYFVKKAEIELDKILTKNYGDNAKAALITRGNAELSRLGIAMGCKPETFAGLSGMGDLIVTCTSMHSRNLHAGMLIGRGKSVEDAKTEVGQVVEGINALPAACHLAKKYKVEMPIVQAVEAILDGKLEARNALMALMGRNLKRE